MILSFGCRSVRLLASIPSLRKSLIMKSLAQSQAARRRAAAAAAMASVGAGILGTQSAEAGIVPINLASAGDPGVDITGVSAGLPTAVSQGNYTFYTFSKTVSNFPLTGGGTLTLMNYQGSNGSTGLSPSAGLTIAVNGGNASPHDFAYGAFIGGTSPGVTWSSDYEKTVFFQYYPGTATSPTFGDGSYLGFKTSQGNYGWLKATWDGTNFELYSGYYESVAGVSIKAGDDGSSAVPEIDPSGLASAMSLVIGSAAMLEQRRRKRAAAAAESTAVTA